MIHLIHGKDAYRVRAALAAVREGMGVPADLMQGNVTVLDGRSIGPDELLAHATSVPFLAPARLVVVEGLLKAIGEGGGGRRRRKKPEDDPLRPWREVAARLDSGGMPETTTLAFVEGELDRRNAAFPIFAPIARTVECAPLAGEELVRWVTDAAKRKGARLEPDVARRLAELVGGDLWALDNELDKVAAYADGESVTLDAVASLVTAAQETKVWHLADAVAAGDERGALSAMSRLLADGEAAPLLAFMVVRAYRQLAVVKDLRERRAPPAEVARLSGVPSFRLNAVGAIASRYSWARLREAYRVLLEADLSVKRGLQDDESSLQLLVHELCALAPSRSGRPAAGVR